MNPPEDYRRFWEAKGRDLGAPPPEHLERDAELAGCIYELMSFVAEQELVREDPDPGESHRD